MPSDYYRGGDLMDEYVIPGFRGRDTSPVGAGASSLFNSPLEGKAPHVFCGGSNGSMKRSIGEEKQNGNSCANGSDGQEIRSELVNKIKKQSESDLKDDRKVEEIDQALNRANKGKNGYSAHQDECNKGIGLNNKTFTVTPFSLDRRAQNMCLSADEINSTFLFPYGKGFSVVSKRNVASAPGRFTEGKRDLLLSWMRWGEAARTTARVLHRKRESDTDEGSDSPSEVSKSRLSPRSGESSIGLDHKCRDMKDLQHTKAVKKKNTFIESCKKKTECILHPVSLEKSSEGTTRDVAVLDKRESSLETPKRVPSPDISPPPRTSDLAESHIGNIIQDGKTAASVSLSRSGSSILVGAPHALFLGTTCSLISTPESKQLIYRDKQIANEQSDSAKVTQERTQWRQKIVHQNTQSPVIGKSKVEIRGSPSKRNNNFVKEKPRCDFIINGTMDSFVKTAAAQSSEEINRSADDGHSPIMASKEGVQTKPKKESIESIYTEICSNRPQIYSSSAIQEGKCETATTALVATNVSPANSTSRFSNDSLKSQRSDIFTILTPTGHNTLVSCVGDTVRISLKGGHIKAVKHS